ncbi:MAG: gliding motility-associated C-terminal domain-containing protein [Chitinophagales bacterium]
MKKTILLTAFVFSILFAGAQCVTNVNFSSWQQGGQPGNGNWSLQSGGTQIYQSVNGDPSFFYSPFDMMNVHISGEFRSTDTDDDYMGFVFSFLNPLGATDSFDCWLFDWKQANQGGAPSGKSLNRVNGVITPADYNNQFWNHQNSAAFTVVQNDFGGAGWSWLTWHNFDLYLTYTSATIYIDGALVFDQQDCFKPGRFGFYNLSQRDCYYRNFQYEVFVDFQFSSDKVCLGDPVQLQFLNPCVPTFLNQYQSVTWNYGDGTSNTINTPTFATINSTHTYTTAGTYTATLTVLDFNGCSSSATQTVEVRNPISLSPTVVQPACNGASTGSIGVTATDGFGNYQYSWNGGVNTQATWTGVNAGTYTVSVTDGYCASSAQYTVNQPTALSATTSHTDAPCGSNGTATIAISGGTPPYTGVNWAGFPGSTVSLPAGTWIADFHDANGCSALLQYTETITALPCGLTSSTSVVNVSCFNGSNGSATLTVTGSTAPVNITWSNGATGATASGLAAGTYTYNYSDGNAAHAFSGSVTITQPGAAMVAQLATTAISCAGSNNGQAIASVISGGNTPYNYTWSGGQPNNPVASNLGPGVITVTVTDGSGCTATASGNVSGIPSLSTSFVTVMDSCFHAGRGSATVRVSGGSAPYTYSWNNFATDTTNANIIAGTYSVTVTDNNGCTTSGSATVPGPANPLYYTSTIQHVNCNGNSTGSYNITPTGGTAGYTFQWNPNISTSNNLSGLAAGIYTFTITDSYACTVIGGDTVEQPATALSATSSHTNVTCNGAANGTITLTLNGGTAPYTYQGTPIPAGTNTLPNLAAGIYSGNVIDSKGCVVALSETITEPGPQSVSVTGNNNPCFGVSMGDATANFINATGAVTYNWTGGLTGSNITNLAAGTYSVTATDQNSCTATSSITITQPAAVNLNVSVTNALCNGANGSATANPVGGTAPFNYSWSNSATGQTIPLPAGTYTVTSTDAIGCQQTGTVTITEPAGIVFQQSNINVLCFGANTGSSTLTVSGGAGPAYTFTWNPNVSTSNTANALTAGTYNITVTDAAACPLDTFIVITQPASALTDSVSKHDVFCFGQANGTIDLFTSGGTGPYSYQWSPNVSTGNSATALIAGTYDITINDANLCSLTESVLIAEPAALTFTQAQIDLTCFGINTGTASVTVSGGTLPYTYSWSSGVSNTNSASTLAAGSYNVTMTDNSLCTVTTTFVIAQPTQLTVSENHTNNFCSGSTNAQIITSVNGGTPGYTYSWNPSISTTDSALNLTAATYALTVTDLNNCTATVSVSITSPALLDVTATATNALCFGDNNGTVTAVSTGGTSPYSYTLTSDGVNFQNSGTGQYTSLTAATYAIVVTDNNACADSTIVTVNQPQQITSLVTATDASCYGYTDGTITIQTSGGQPIYNYSLSSGAQNSSGVFTNLATGNYTVTITDANNCSISDAANIQEPAPVSITATPNPVVVNLGESMQLQTSTTQTGSVTYNWTPAFGLSCYDCPSPVFSGNYSVVYTVNMSTSAGCTGNSTISVTVVPNYDLFIPNAFTPNGDGANDFWSIYGNMQAIKQLNVMVFNRWGEKVFETDDINFAWNGEFKGAKLPPAVYTYVARFVWLNDHSDSDYKGTVTLIK